MKVHKVGVIRGGGRICALSATFLLAMTASAKLKYWTTGGYDADSYVQDGLVLNYDGIRNVGLDQEHSYDTTTWVNLGTEGAKYDLSLSVANKGEWGDDGFDFKKATTFFSSANLTIPTVFSVQTLLDATTADNYNVIGYVFFPVGKTAHSDLTSDQNDRWRQFSIGLRGTANASASSPLGNPDRLRLNCSTFYSNRDISGTSFGYATGIFTGSTVSFFSGTSISGTYTTSKTPREIPCTAGWGVGGNPGGSLNSASQALNGTVKYYRQYNKALTADELVWNRAVDQTRYFGAAPLKDIPVTNAVIASSIAVVHGNEKSGAYAVDASGYTFTAPASRTVEGRKYTCSGYTIAEWDAGAGVWGEATTQSDTSVTVSSSQKVRIIWQWTPGDGIVTRYDVGDYVQDGLLLNYDGIRNAGAGEPHSAAPERWVNLAPGGGLDMTLQVINTEGADPGEWRRDGYHFECQSYFHPGAAFTLPSNQTIQVAVDANGLGQKAYNGSADSNEAYIYYASGVEFNKAGSLSLRRDTSANYYNEWFDWTVHGYGDSNTRPKPGQYRGLPVRYCTAVLADTFGAAFMGTSVPTEQTAVNGSLASRRDFTSGPPIVQNATDFGIGGLASETGYKFTGTLQSFRFYNRVLTNAELEHNRVIDDYRFHGVIPVTNVVVASSRLGMEGNEKIGPYEISGTYTFTAPASRTDARGFTFACTGYTLEEWNASAGCWNAPVSYETVSYTWAASSSPAKVRLTWQWKATAAIFTAADYDITDYVAGGLVLNFDGIKNLGADLPDVTNRFSRLSKAWVNSAPFGGYDMGFSNKGPTTSWLGDSTWTDNGFTFTNKSFFSHSGAFTVSPKSTQQTLVDGIGKSLNNGGSLDNGDTPRGYVFMASGAWSKAGSFSFVSDGSSASRPHSWIDLAAHGFTSTSGDTARCDPPLAYGAKLTYATGIMGDGYMAAFYGTEIPTNTTTRWTNPSRLPTTGFGLEPTTVTVSYLGAGGSGGAQAFTGTVKSYRYYDRPLTNDELKHNRNVDSARFFGVLATTNIVVGTEAYKVEGSYEFEAPATVEVDGVEKEVAGYRLYVLKNGTEEGRPWHRGTTFTYPDDLPDDLKAAGATVRLEWEAEPPGLMILIR